MSDYFPLLPGDVVKDILVRLPLDTLLRCTCVSKSWYSLLTNPAFITKHLNVNRCRSRHLLLVRSYSDSDNQEHYSLRYDDDEWFAEYGQLHFPLKSLCNQYYRIIGFCNGLICLSDDQFTNVNQLFLWNPTIRKVMPLPPVGVFHGSFMHTIGFGFDPLTDDYKVVRIVHLNDNFDNPTEIEIFSLSTGTWRNITPHVAALPPLPDIIINDRAPQAFLMASAHWIASSRGAESDYGRVFFILSFHMGREKFGQIMLPHNIMENANPFLMSGIGFRVAKFQKKLALIHLTGTGSGSQDDTCSIWVMNNYGVAESWTKQFTIDMTKSFNSVAGFTRKGQLLLPTTAGYLVAFHPQPERLMHLLIRGSTNSAYRHTSFYADAYRVSLVLLGKRFSDTGGEGGGRTSEESESSPGSVEGGSVVEEIKNRFVTRVENEYEETSEDGQLLKE